jgi:hypothetical protein
VTNVGFAAALLVTMMMNDLENYVLHAPIDGLCLYFQMMDTKAKDELVLSVIWCWKTLKSSNRFFVYRLAIL